MSLNTMRRFTALRREGEAGRPGRLTMLLEHRAAVRRRVEQLRQNLHVIDLKIDKHRRVLRQQGVLPVSQTVPTWPTTADQPWASRCDRCPTCSWPSPVAVSIGAASSGAACSA